MQGDEQARAYAEADFSEPHERFVALLAERLPDLPESAVAVDLGCGPGDIAFRFARVFPRWQVDAVDGSLPMLALGRRAAAARDGTGRVRFHLRHLPDTQPPSARYALLFSNSLLHHLADPGALWTTLRQWGAAGSAVFVMDLLRPASRDAARALVELYAGGEPEILRADFFHSLCAAYRPDEVRAQLAAAGLALEVEVVSDRHLIAWGRLAGG
jgi:trans-aconitate methyltransferase